MSKFNLEKARNKLRAAENEALRYEILSCVPDKTTSEYLEDLERETGWTKTHFARFTGYSYNAVKRWAKENENTVVVKFVCNDIKRRYWHQRNKERYQFDFEEE